MAPVGPEGDVCWPRDRAIAVSPRPGKRRLPCMGPGDCHICDYIKFNMQAAMALVLAKRWPYVTYVVLRWP